MLNINENYSKLHTNKLSKPIKEGDIVKYTIIKRISKDKAIVNVMGKNLTAEIKGDTPEKGFAKVVSVLDKLMLSIMKENAGASSKDDLNYVQIRHKNENNPITAMLNGRGIKASPENMRYLETVLKYMPNMNEDVKSFIFTAISNGVYMSVEELNTLFSGVFYENLFKEIKKLLYDIKNSNKNPETAEKLIRIAENLNNFNSISANIKDYITTNGYFSIWFMLFDTLKLYGRTEGISLLLKSLSANRKSKFLKENAFFIPIPFMLDGQIKEINLFIHSPKSHDEGFRLIFVAYDKDFELCKISVSKAEDVYLIHVSFFDENLYKMYDFIRENVNKEIEDLSFKNGISINVEYEYEKR